MSDTAAPGVRVIRATAADEEQWGELADWAELGAIRDAIDVARDEVKRLEEERAGIYRSLLAQGVPRAAMARQAGVGDMAVRFVLEPDLRKDRGKAK